MPAHVLLNPAARGGRNARLRGVLADHLAAAGVDADVVETAGPGDAERIAREIGGVGGLVVVAGGDGTVHEAVNGLAGTDGTLGVLALGTGNDYAGALGMARDLGAACRQLATAPRRVVDVGHVRWTDAAGATHERLFANAVGIGFDAYASALAAETKWLGGRAAYLAAVARALWAWRRPSVSVRMQAPGADGGPLDVAGPLFLCEVGNGPSIGGGFRLTPDAVLDDGWLDVCHVRHLPTRRALWLLPQTFNGSHVTAPEATMARVPSVTLTAGPGGVGIQAEGEVLAADAVEVRVEVRPAALRVVAPSLARCP